MITLPRKVSTWLPGADFGRQVFQFAADVFDALKALRAEQRAQDLAIQALQNESPDGGIPGAHASTHLPGGSDALTTAAAGTITPGDTASAGSAASFSASDHRHAIAGFGTTAGTFAQGNDARLSDDRTASGLRTASTVVVVSAATAPSSGQVLTASSSTAAAWATPASASEVLPPLFVKPTSPHAQDDEFDSTTLNSAWKLYDENADALIAFGAGAPDQYTANTTTGMRTDVSTTWPSWLLMQPKNTALFYWVAKNYSLATDQWICCRVTGGFRLGQSDLEIEYGIIVSADNAGIPDKANSVTLTTVPTGGQHSFQFAKKTAGVNAALFNTSAIPNGGLQGVEFLVLQKVGTTYHAWAVGHGGASLYFGSTTHASTMAWVGIRCRQQIAGVTGMLVHWDHIRFRDAVVAF